MLLCVDIPYNSSQNDGQNRRVYTVHKTIFMQSSFTITNINIPSSRQHTYL